MAIANANVFRDLRCNLHASKYVGNLTGCEFFPTHIQRLIEKKKKLLEMYQEFALDLHTGAWLSWQTKAWMDKPYIPDKFRYK
eukprot:2567220-Amphidinium_carterae.1